MQLPLERRGILLAERIYTNFSNVLSAMHLRSNIKVQGRAFVHVSVHVQRMSAVFKNRINSSRTASRTMECGILEWIKSESKTRGTRGDYNRVEEYIMVTR